MAIHAWESIQKAVDFIEENLDREIPVEELAEVAALSLFYFQRLFARLVKRPVREYIKLRRLAHGAKGLKNGSNYMVDIAVAYGFGSRETFSRAFKEVYGISPSEYRDNPMELNYFDRPNLFLDYVMVDEDVPLITEGIVLEYSRKTLDTPIYFLGVEDLWRFKPGKMLGERPGVSDPAAIWDRFYQVIDTIPCIPYGRRIGVSYHGDAPEGYSTYFVGAEAEMSPADTGFASWVLPARAYVVCRYEAEDFPQLAASLGKMMKFTRYWLKEHGLRADGFFPEIYYNNPAEADHAYMEMWIPFKAREENE